MTEKAERLTPDQYRSLAACKRFRLIEAATFWEGFARLVPPSDTAAVAAVRDRYEKLCEAAAGALRLDAPPKPTRRKQGSNFVMGWADHQPTRRSLQTTKSASMKARTVSAAELRLYAESIGERPEFLFPPVNDEGETGDPRGDLHRIRREFLSVAINVLGYDPMKIPDGGKAKIKAACLRAAPRYFTDSAFDHEWKSWRSDGTVEMENADKFRPK